jgi:tryptophan synthase alpha chain
MSKITSTFADLSQDERTALMPYVTMGYPKLESAREVIPAIVEAGADLIELGVPFSDPLADGAVIQASSQQALANGMTLDLCLDQAATLRAQKISTPFVMMSYYNPIFQIGLERFAQRAAASGIDGVIVPDLPPEESEVLRTVLATIEIDLVFLLAPTANDERVRLVADCSSGFVYLVSLTGITGARERLPSELEAFVQRSRAATSLPLAVGFGIGTPAQAARVASVADGVIVGSALIKKLGQDNPVAAARTFVASLRDGIDTKRI